MMDVSTAVFLIFGLPVVPATFFNYFFFPFFSVDLLCQVYLPMSELVANSPRIVNPFGRTWENVLTVTRQPSTEGIRATG